MKMTITMMTDEDDEERCFIFVALHGSLSTSFFNTSNS